MTKTKTAIRVSTISLLAISLLSIGFVNTQFAAATTETFTNNTFGLVDGQNGGGLNTITRTVDVTNAQIPAGELITDVNIAVDFEKDGDNDCLSDSSFSYSNEISMSLQGPSATVVNLVFDDDSFETYPNQNDVDRVVVTFDDSASDLVGTTNGGLPETGTFQPAEPLSAFNGEAPQGTWTLTLGDNFLADPLCFYQFDLTIVAQGSTEVDVDIKPQSCPNPINTHSKGVIPVAILGTDSFDVAQIDASSIQLEGISPIQHDIEDVASPLLVPTVPEPDSCTDEGPDGFDDLTLKFDAQEVVAALGLVAKGDVISVELTGTLLDGTPFEGYDIIIIK